MTEELTLTTIVEMVRAVEKLMPQAAWDTRLAEVIKATKPYIPPPEPLASVWMHSDLYDIGFDLGHDAGDITILLAEGKDVLVVRRFTGFRTAAKKIGHKIVHKESGSYLTSQYMWGLMKYTAVPLEGVVSAEINLHPEKMAMTKIEVLTSKGSLSFLRDYRLETEDEHTKRTTNH